MDFNLYWSFKNKIASLLNELGKREAVIRRQNEYIAYLQSALDKKEKELKAQKDITKGLQSKVRKVKRRIRNELPKK